MQWSGLEETKVWTSFSASAEVIDGRVVMFSR